MVIEEPVQPGAAALAAAKAYLRVETADEDGLIASLVASAAALCEAFTGQVLIRRGFQEVLPRSGCWQRLGRTPVSAVAAVEAAGDGGVYAPLMAADYAVDIDAAGDGWVRAGGTGRVRISYQAGLAADWSGAPEALRQGIIRLAAHFYMHRSDEEETAPPAAVAALWRPWRRMRLR
ncbi:MAG TPA: hypothetical protein VF662_01005 [Allosphingosinicella sp.]|jgi:uncharacterized phiE125 gp8 family phage protein